jgi:hypothetical protein
VWHVILPTLSSSFHPQAMATLVVALAALAVLSVLWLAKRVWDYIVLRRKFS